MTTSGRLVALLAMVALATGYSIRGLWPAVIFSIAIGAIWIGGDRLGLPWANGAGLMSCAGACTFGIWSHAPALWMLAGLIAGLIAWDLLRFSYRLKMAGRVDDGAVLQRAHLRRLLLAAVPGVLLGAVSQIFTAKLSFAAALFLGALAMLGLSRAVGLIQRRSD